MNNRLSAEIDKQPKVALRDGAAPTAPVLAGQAPGRVAGDGAVKPFDVDAWEALIEQQRLRIAIAAGVDASKVSIHIGH